MRQKHLMQTHSLFKAFKINQIYICYTPRLNLPSQLHHLLKEFPQIVATRGYLFPTSILQSYTTDSASLLTSMRGSKVTSSIAASEITSPATPETTSPSTSPFNTAAAGAATDTASPFTTT